MALWRPGTLKMKKPGTLHKILWLRDAFRVVTGTKPDEVVIFIPKRWERRVLQAVVDTGRTKRNLILGTYSNKGHHAIAFRIADVIAGKTPANPNFRIHEGPGVKGVKWQSPTKS